jgi:hypothetical protein
VKNIVVTVAVVIIVGLILFFPSPDSEMERGIGSLQLGYIVLSVLAGVILLVMLIRYFQAIKRLVLTDFPSIVTIAAAGALVFMLVHISWPVEIAMKAEFLWSVLVASLALAGFVAVIPLRLIRGEGDFRAKLGISEIGMENLRTFLYRSAALGCLTILAIVLYFIIGEANLFFIAWLLFILQLGLLISPLIFARIMVFR